MITHQSLYSSFRQRNFRMQMIQQIVIITQNDDDEITSSIC